MERVINTILKNIAKENNYTYETYSHDWIVRLTNKDKRLTTYGYIMQGIDSVSQIGVLTTGPLGNSQQNNFF